MENEGGDEEMIISTALDYTKLEAINQRRQTEHINHFLLNTVHFFNQFTAQIESKFQKLETNLQRIDADFAILDSKLRSTPNYQPLELVDVLSPVTTATTTAETINTSIPTAGAAPPPPPPPPPEPEKEEDPRTEKYRKMLAVKVPRDAVRHKMVAEGLDAATIESVIGPD